MSSVMGSRHLGDEELIRYMDHQVDREGLRRARSHLAVCADCAARLEAMQAKSAAVREALSLLGGGDPDPLRRAAAQDAIDRARFRRSASGPISSRVFWPAAAAVLVLVCVGGLGTRPGRAWVSDIVARLAGDAPGAVASKAPEWLDDAPAPAPAAVAEAEPPQAAAAAPARRYPPGVSPPVSFQVETAVMTLRFDSRQAVGNALVRLSETDNAAGQVIRGHEGERLVPIEDGMQVRNRPDSRADYEFVVPSHVRYVRVRVGNDSPAMFPVRRTKQDYLFQIPLQESAEQPSGGR